MWDPPCHTLSLACLRKRTAFSQKIVLQPSELVRIGLWEMTAYLTQVSQGQGFTGNTETGLRQCGLSALSAPALCTLVTGHSLATSRLHRTASSADFPPSAAPSTPPLPSASSFRSSLTSPFSVGPHGDRGKQVEPTSDFISRLHEIIAACPCVSLLG